MSKKRTKKKKQGRAHKHRFNTDGSGRGKAGRDSVAKGSGNTPHANSLRDNFYNPSGEGTKISDPTEPPKKVVKKKKKVVKKKKSTGSTGVTTKKKKKKKKGGGSIFDRLTDSSKYTGSHKNRFNEDGSGRGKAGRDLGAVGKGSMGGAPW